MECENGAFTLVLKGTLSLYYFAALNQSQISSTKSEVMQMLWYQILPQLFHRNFAILPHFGCIPLQWTMPDTQILAPPTFNRRPKMSSHVGFSWVWGCRFWWACLRGNVDFGAPTLGVNLNFSDLRWTYPRYKAQLRQDDAHFRGPTLVVNSIGASSSLFIQMPPPAVFS